MHSLASQVSSAFEQAASMAPGSSNPTARSLELAAPGEADQMLLDLVSEGSAGNYGLAAAAVGVALFSVVSKEALFRWTLDVGSRIGSPTIVSNAWHHRSDALSSLTALAGITGAIAGVPALDPAAGLVVSALIVQVVLGQGRDALRELSEEQVGVDDALGRARAAAVRLEDVKCYRKVRGRRLGHYVLVEMEAGVSPQLTVSAAERVAEQLRAEVMRTAPDVADVIVRTFAHRGGGATGTLPQLGSSGAPSGAGAQRLGECICDDDWRAGEQGEEETSGAGAAKSTRVGMQSDGGKITDGHFNHAVAVA